MLEGEAVVADGDARAAHLAGDAGGGEVHLAGQLDAWAFAFRGWALPAVWSQPPYGDPKGWDGYTTVVCTDWGYCLAGGFLTVGDELTGFLRLHNP